MGPWGPGTVTIRDLGCKAIHCHSAYLELLGYLADTEAACQQALDLISINGRPPALVHASLLGLRDAFELTFLAQASLELRKDAQHLEERAPRWR